MRYLLGQVAVRRRPVNLHVWTRLLFATIFGFAVPGDLLESGAPIDARGYITGLAEMAIHGAGPGAL